MGLGKYITSAVFIHIFTFTCRIPGAVNPWTFWGSSFLSRVTSLLFPTADWRIQLSQVDQVIYQLSAYFPTLHMLLLHLFTLSLWIYSSFPPFVLVHSGYYNRKKIIDCVAYKHQKFLKDLEVGKSKIKVSAYLMSGEDLITSSEITTSSCNPHVVKGARELSGMSFWKDINPIHKATTVMT